MVFTVTCPDCSSEFPVDSAKVPEGGVLAQCSACPGTFLVEQPEPHGASEEDRDSPEWLEAVGSDTEAAAADTPDSESSPWLEAPPQDPAEDGTDLEAAPAFASSEDVSGENGQGFDDQEAFTPFDADGASQDAAEESPAEPETSVATAPAFGQSDPDARAARLARVLVSDMMTYNPALYEKAMEAGTLAEDFEDEVKKSWSEYVDQVGEDVARSTPHFTRALNDILAKGEEVFQESMYE